MSELLKRLGDAREFLVIDPSKMDAFTNNKLRLKLLQSGIHILNVKNTLARKVMGEKKVGGLDPFLAGPSALVWGGPDIVALSKEITKWAKEIKTLQIKGATLDGTSLNAKEVDALSKSPGREELIGRVLMLIRSGGGGTLLSTLKGPAGKLAGQVKTLADKEDSAEPEAAPAAS